MTPALPYTITVTAPLPGPGRCQVRPGPVVDGLQLHEQACAGYRHALGDNHPDTLAARVGLADAYLAAGRLSDAATLLRDTLARCEQTLPPGDPLTQALRQSITGLTGQ